MRVKITHFARGNGGYYMLFTGQSDDWTAVKEKLKKFCRGPFKGAWYAADYKWPGREKAGAWWVSPTALMKMGGYFINLEEMLDEVDEEDDEEETPEPEPEPPPQSLPKMPATMQESYAVFNLPMSASLDDVKKRYHALAVIYHPDHGGDTHQMKLLNCANDIIMRWLSYRAS